MVWTIEITGSAAEQLERLDRPVQKRILDYLHRRLAVADDPRVYGRPMNRRFAGYWRYRMGNYRILCRIQDARLVILVVGVGHRRWVYE